MMKLGVGYLWREGGRHRGLTVRRGALTLSLLRQDVHLRWQW